MRARAGLYFAYADDTKKVIALFLISDNLSVNELQNYDEVWKLYGLYNHDYHNYDHHDHNHDNTKNRASIQTNDSRKWHDRIIAGCNRTSIVLHLSELNSKRSCAKASLNPAN